VVDGDPAQLLSATLSPVCWSLHVTLRVFVPDSVHTPLSTQPP